VQRLGFTLAQQPEGLRAVIHLAAGNAKVNRLAALAGQKVNLGRQTSSGTP
jgi:hypothetical protein